jgi:hypothetical protein
MSARGENQMSVDRAAAQPLPGGNWRAHWKIVLTRAPIAHGSQSRPGRGDYLPAGSPYPARRLEPA